MSRRRLLGCVLLSLSLAVSPVAAEPDPDAALLAYFEAWNSGDVDRLDAIVAPDFKRHGGPEESVASLEQLKQLIVRTRTIYKHLRLTLDDYMTSVDGGAMRGSFYGVHAEVDRVVEFDLASMVRFEDGLIAEEWTMGNNFLVLVGLGFQLTPPGFEVIEAPRETPEETAEPAPEDGS